MVSGSPGNGVRHAVPTTASPRYLGVANERTSPPDSSKRHQPGRLETIRNRFEMQGLSRPMVELLLVGNRPNTTATYGSAWNCWSNWCAGRGVDPMSASVVRILEFLTHLHEIEKSYNMINVYRSMLSTTLPEVNGVKLGVHPLIKRLLAGCFNSNPPRPRYESTWDPQQVISFISGLRSNAQLSLA